MSFLVTSAGLLIGALFTDFLVAALLRTFEISNFSSHPAVENILFPALAVIGVFTISAWFVGGKIKKGDLISLVSYE